MNSTTGGGMKLMYRQHAIRRMFERAISATDINASFEKGSIIEAYPDDKPYPSFLWLGYSGERPLHVVYAENVQDGERIVITVYEPDPEQWESDFMRRRKS